MEEDNSVEDELLTLREEYKHLKQYATDIEEKFQLLLETTTTTTATAGRGEVEASRLCTVIANLFNQQSYSDLVILLEDGCQLWGHKLVLLGCGDYWGVDDLNAVQELDFKDINYDVAYAMMKWVYTDDLDIKMEDIFLLELLQVATKYKLESLHKRCQKALMPVVNIKNCDRVYQRAVDLSALLLMDYCSNFSLHDQKVNRVTIESHQANNLCFMKSVREMSEGSIEESNTSRHNLAENLKYKLSDGSSAGQKTFTLKSKIQKSKDKTSRSRKSEQLLDDGNFQKTIKNDEVAGNNVKGKSLKYLMKQTKKSRRSIVAVSISRAHTHKKPVPVTQKKPVPVTQKKPVPVSQKKPVPVSQKKPVPVTQKNPADKKPVPLSHKKPESVSKLHSCELCGKLFINNSNLVNHIRTHSGEKPFKCDVCSKTFSEKGNLQKHMKIHSGEKPFTCEICGTSFNTIRSLQRHSMLHLGEKPFKCDICNKTFNTQSYVDVHKRIHSGEKPFTCDVCGKSFTESCNLQAHMRIHLGEKPYKCDVCGKAFTQSTYVKIHKRIHSDERPYSCIECEKRFRTSSALQTHVRIHSGEKPYQCEVCYKTFRENSTLKKHHKTHVYVF